MADFPGQVLPVTQAQFERVRLEISMLVHEETAVISRDRVRPDWESLKLSIYPVCPAGAAWETCPCFVAVYESFHGMVKVYPSVNLQGDVTFFSQNMSRGDLGTFGPFPSFLEALMSVHSEQMTLWMSAFQQTLLNLMNNNQIHFDDVVMEEDQDMAGGRRRTSRRRANRY